MACGTMLSIVGSKSWMSRTEIPCMGHITVHVMKVQLVTYTRTMIAHNMLLYMYMQVGLVGAHICTSTCMYMAVCSLGSCGSLIVSCRQRRTHPKTCTCRMIIASSPGSLP